MRQSLLLVAFAGLMFTGCVSTHDTLIKAGHDPAYADGFSDGEESGYFAARNPYCRFTKDTHRFDSDSQYRQGWNDGYDAAKTHYQSLRR